MSNDKEFWNDADMREWAAFYSLKSSNEDEFKMFQYFDEWKQSKQPKRDWEIFSYGVGLPNPIILKVKRLSDNEVLSIDDITNYGRITGFRNDNIILPHRMEIEFEGGSRFSNLNIIRKVKQQFVFSEEDMCKCFYAGRLAGMKYDSFQEYIQSLNK